jgi:hypothetical protein
LSIQIDGDTVMAEEKRGFWVTLPGILTGVAGVITAVLGVYTALQHADSAPRPESVPRQEEPLRLPRHNEPEPEPERRVAPNEPETKPPGLSVAALSGAWSLSGAMQNGTPLSGQAYLNENLTFQTGAQGIVTAAGAWNIDASQRTVHLQGRHILYGTPANFTCTLNAEDTAGRSLQGTCTDFAGTGSLRLAH